MKVPCAGCVKSGSDPFLPSTLAVTITVYDAANTIEGNKLLPVLRRSQQSAQQPPELVGHCSKGGQIAELPGQIGIPVALCLR